MNFKKVIFLISLVTIVSCKTVSIHQEVQKSTTTNKILGSISESKDYVLEQSYNNIALPKYNIPIKMEAQQVAFSKSTYKAFTKANTSQNANLSINYIDSLENKPQFLKLELADRLTVINALNNKSNTDVKNYLENKNESHIVSGVSIAFSQSDLDIILQADEVFLEATGIKSYALKIYKDSKLQQTILFKQGVVFAYKTSSFCWQEDGKYQLQIVDLAEGNSCPKRTYKSAKNAKKKIDYFKFQNR